jgi:hypothetical protein
VGDPGLGYLIAGAALIGGAFLIVLVAFIGWLQNRDNRRQS